jgi:hypothetical protein
VRIGSSLLPSALLTRGRSTPHAQAAHAHLVPVSHRRALRVVPSLRADNLIDLLFHQLRKHAQPQPHAQGEQPFPGRVHQLPERLARPCLALCQARWATSEA